MNEYKLKDLIHIHNGRPYAHLSDGIIPVYGSGGIICYVNEALYDREAILLPRKGTLNYIMYSNQKIWVIDTMYYATTNNKACPYYLYRYLGLLNLSHLDSGSALPSMTQATYYDIKVKLPNIKTQQRIASVLSALDDKIELNNRINAELEAMAKTLYDYWFVQFDFPDENGNPYKSSGGKMVYSEELKREIPEGWEVKRIGDIINPLESGKRPKGGIDKTLKDGIPSLGAECIDKLGVFNYSSTRYIPYSYKEKITSGVIKDNDILIYKDGAYVGKTTLFRDNFPFSYAVVNEHVFLVRAKKKEMQEYLLLTLMQNYYFNIMQSLAQKAAQPGLNQEDLKSIIIIVPNDYITNKFNCITVTMFKNLFSLANENQQLASLRDWLLPMLMNGQVGFKETTHKEEIIKSQQKKQHLELLLSQ
jgi:type I restriction enzyme, S subunit